MDRNDDNTRNTVHNTGAPKTDNILHHDDNPGVGDIVGEGVGGFSGVFAGAAIGAMGGPIGAIIGSIAGAVGGWWTGRTVSEAATHMTGGDSDTHYRAHYEGSTDRLADRSYDDVRPAYQLGHLAGMNPDYHGRDFDAVESDLQRGWGDDVRNKHGDWQQVRGYARDAFTRSRSGSPSAGAAGATAASGAAYAADRTGNTVSNAAHDVKRGAEHLGHGIANAADDLKDRVDGNPASRPGPDATDSTRRI